MSPLSGLPRCVALRSKHDNSYLRSVHDESHGGSFVELCGGGGVMNPRCRFYLEASKEHDGLLHVRCCNNNKYWVPHQRVLDGSTRWIIGTANELEEDLSKPSCTLFKHVPVDGFSRFLHPHLGNYAGVKSGSHLDKRSYLHIAHEKADQDKHLMDAFTVLDLSQQRQLPKYVAFKGSNGAFLCGKSIEGYNYLEFSNQEIGDPSVMQTIFTDKDDDGVVRIKSNHFGRFWRLSPGWIWADSNDTTKDNHDTLFSVTTASDYIALKNLGNKKFCKVLTADGKTGCLNACADSITTEAKIQFFEPVVSRQIYDVEFHLHDARITTTGIDGLYDQHFVNDGSMISKGKLEFTYTNTVQSSWSCTVSLKTGIAVSLEAGIPSAADGKVEVSAEFSASYNWGEVNTKSSIVTQGVDVEVPPMKKLTVSAIGSNGICDIPFSYKQKDVLRNGEVVVQNFDDGIYFGVKTSEVTFHIKEEDL